MCLCGGIHHYRQRKRHVLYSTKIFKFEMKTKKEGKYKRINQLWACWRKSPSNWITKTKKKRKQTHLATSWSWFLSFFFPLYKWIYFYLLLDKLQKNESLTPPNISMFPFDVNNKQKIDRFLLTWFAARLFPSKQLFVMPDSS